MKNIPDFGTILVFALVFWLIFYLVSLFLERFGVKDEGIHLLVHGLISAWALVCWPRGEDWEMKKIIKKHWKISIIILLTVLVIGGIYSYHHWYLPYKHAQIVAQNLKNGFVIVDTFDCPKDHSIKANLKSMIYHTEDSPYYKRTNAANGYCFDISDHAIEQGFREPYNR